MLTAGRYLPNLIPEIINKSRQRRITYVTDVVEVTKSEMERQWQEHLSEIEEENFLDNRFFGFIVGFNRTGNPHLYYLDNQTTPPFTPQRREIIQEVEIGALSSGSNVTENPGDELAYYLNLEAKKGNFQKNSTSKIYNAFANALNNLSLRNLSIGGRIFFSILDFENGYQIIE